MSEPATRIDPRFGHRTLDPLPTLAALNDFFATQYYAMVDAGARAPDIARARRGGGEADEQQNWLKQTLHRDFADAITEHARGKRVLDVGCGMGALMISLREHGFDVEGLDIAPDAVSAVGATGFAAHQGALLDLEATGTLGAYDAICFANVLGESLDPYANLAAAARLLAPAGVVVVRAGNQFNPLQEAAVQALGKPRWWISPPDQVNYLNYASLEAMMNAAGMALIEKRSDFPFEMFLLMGFDYLGDPKVGAECHARRVRFELATPVETRRALYRAFAAANMGRCVFMVGQKPA